ncbi:MAG: hypothetical protein PWQ67_1572 [Clostridia bacterium]|nr:hypothetical protein [Clostridia bacterium]
MRNKLLLCSVLILIFILTGCTGNDPDKNKKEKIDTKKVQEMSAYIGSEACISCHTETGQGFTMTSHANIFKPLDQYNLNWDQKVVIWDDANKENPAEKEINLKNSYGVMMDHYVVAKVDGFTKDLYRVAALEKTDQGFKIEAVSLKDYNSDNNQDWGAKAYTCADCHSPGLVAEGQGIKNLDAGISCETCHGPGSIHAQTKKKEAIDINEDACISCHTLGQPTEAKNGETLIAQNHYGTRNWFASDHYTSGYVNCLNCHTSHEVNVEGIMLNGTFEENCAKCHKGETFNIDEIMWKNPSDPYNHITRDHSFGAFSYDKLGDNPETKEIEITDPTTVRKLKSLMKDIK